MDIAQLIETATTPARGADRSILATKHGEATAATPFTLGLPRPALPTPQLQVPPTPLQPNRAEKPADSAADEAAVDEEALQLVGDSDVAPHGPPATNPKKIITQPDPAPEISLPEKCVYAEDHTKTPVAPGDVAVTLPPTLPTPISKPKTGYDDSPGDPIPTPTPETPVSAIGAVLVPGVTSPIVPTNPAKPVNDAKQRSDTYTGTPPPAAQGMPVQAKTTPTIAVPPVVVGPAPEVEQSFKLNVFDETSAVPPLSAPTRSATPASVVAAPHIAEQHRAQQVAGQIVSTISRAEGDRIELRLDPPELGRVLIQLHMREGEMSAIVTTERADTAELMRRHADILARELARAGLAGAELSFRSQAEQQNHQHAEQDSRNRGPMEATGPAGSPAQQMALAVARGLTADGSLDIRL